MKVKLDEAISSRFIAEPLEAAGHDVATVPDQGWGGLKDPVLWPKVQAERIFLITPDKGFGDIRAFPPGTHAGILVLRPKHESLLEFRALIEFVLTSQKLETLAGAVSVVSAKGLRIRRN